MFIGKKPKNGMIIPAMIGALTALTVGGILITSAMYCDPIRDFLLSAKKEAKKAYKVVEDEIKKI
ncbi:MAG: hypothetical protein PHY15_05065 [Eubacteriales bacterium]|nr:hypothetical protein [Eubacteriales bacterium]MDD4475457.1 hypothetical protein [Eubacteriales bacterium]